MKAVMISIRPEWCEKIISGEKTIEVRKTRPKMETPFKCYIYCTLPPRSELFRHGCIVEYANELIRLQNGKIVYGYGMQLCCDEENRPYSKDNFLCQKVIGEFNCDEIIPIKVFETGAIQNYNFYGMEKTCLSYDEIARYIGFGKTGCGWHISSIKIYDRPKSVYEFMKPCESDLYCEVCGLYSEFADQCGNRALVLKRPPQSWCYVEEVIT